MNCASCQALLPGGARFCPSCGQAVVAQKTDENLGERRHLTVMFCDLVGATRLSSELDPERYHEGIQAYYAGAEGIVKECGGHVAQYLGDGILAYFGYPTANEHDADRAVMAAEKLTQARLGDGFRVSIAPAVRVGVHSGTVVVEGASARYGGANLVFGDTTNIASRVQNEAEPDSALISAATKSLLRANVQLESIGSKNLKGVPVPMELFRVLGGTRNRRLPADPASNCGPMMGREAECDQIDTFLLADSDSLGHTGILLIAEAGLGKSRLMAAQKDRLRIKSPGVAWIEVRCSPFAVESAFAPLIELMQVRLDEFSSPTTASSMEALRDFCPDSVKDSNHWLSLICPLLGLELPKGLSPPQFSPGLKRRKTIEVLVAWIRGFAQAAQTVFAIEDLHWADPLTREVIGNLLELQSECANPYGLRLLISSRPEQLPDWHQSGHLMQLQLSSLSNEASRALIQQVPGADVLPGPVRAAIVERAGGVPLFLEELVKTVLETHDKDQLSRLTSGADDKPLKIPDSLQDSLLARLDKLGPAKSTAQLCSVVGREFQMRLLLHAWPDSRQKLTEDLQALLESGLISPSPGVSDSYSFKHALVQDAAYDTMLRTTRTQLHRKIAAAIEELSPKTMETEPERLAWHHERGDQPNEAIDQLICAVSVAARRSASQQASAFATRALDLLPKLEDPEKIARLEVELQVMRGSQLVSVAGYAHPDVGDAFSKARSAFTKATPPHIKAGVLRGLSVVHLVRAEHEKSLELAWEMRDLGDSVPDSMVRFAGHVGSIFPLGHMGRLEEAFAAFHHADRGYQPEWANRALTVFSQNLKVAANGYIAIVMWLAGKSQTAESILQESESFAARESHAFDQAYVQAWYCLLLLLTGQIERAMEKIDRLLAFAQGNDIFHWIWNGRIQKGLAMALSGEHEAGLKLMRESHAFLQRVGGPIDGPMMYCLEAEVCLNIGHFDAADVALDKGEAISRDMGERNWDAELRRCRGLLMERAKQDFSGAMTAFEEAIAIARAQGAHLPGLRAANELSRLSMDRGDTIQWRETLSSALASVEEKQGLRDCQVATELLERSGSEAPIQMQEVKN